jgi:hypothetical protein
MKAPGLANTPSAVAAIPIATRLRVTLRNNVDLLRAKAGETFQGVLAAPVRLPDGAILHGAAVILV